MSEQLDSSTVEYFRNTTEILISELTKIDSNLRESKTTYKQKYYQKKKKNIQNKILSTLEIMTRIK